MTRRGRPFARPLRWLGFATVAGLGAFHAELFWQRLLNSSLAEPGVALRWLGAGLLLAALAALRSRGVPLFRDRRSLGLWLAALLLHLGTTPAVALNPEWLAVPTLAAVSFVGAELVVLVAREGRRPIPLAPVAPHTATRRSASPTRPRRLMPSFLPRPPPAFG